MIFIHSSFRVASTWLWSRFRQAQDTYAYCEIFHESFATLTRVEAEQSNRASWYSKHPDGAPYFLELLPLIKDNGGVVGYDASMAFELFIPEDGPKGMISGAERAYISNLAKYAINTGKTPVLTACRSLGRVAGIKQAFPGYHIVLYRNLFQQWCSYLEQHEYGNSYFLNTLKWVVERSQHDSFMRVVRKLWPIDDVNPSDPRHFLAFVAVHAYLYAHAVDMADLVIDANRLAYEPDYQNDIEAVIEEETGLRVDLSSVRNSISACSAKVPEQEALRDALLPVLNNFLGLPTESKGQRFALKILEDISQEQINYNNHYSVQALEEIFRLRVERKRLMEQLGAATAERDAATAERDAATAERDAATAERDAILSSAGWRITRLLRAVRSTLGSHIR